MLEPPLNNRTNRIIAGSYFWQHSGFLAEFAKKK
jgi:hypothetical protein